MADFEIKVTGLTEAAAGLAGVPGAVAIAFKKSAVIIASEGTRFWRSLVTKRTGQMARSLNVQVVQRGPLAVEIHFYPDQAKAFYYGFQSERSAWNKKLADYLERLAARVVAQQVDREIAKLFP